MPDALDIVLCSKLCRHNPADPKKPYPMGRHIPILGFHMTSIKFKLKKLSILPRFYFHDALEQLKTKFHTNFRSKRVLGFVIEYA